MTVVICKDNGLPYALTRVLDMLDAWSRYPNLLEHSTICELYQEAGNLTANDEEYDPNEPSNERVKQFIEQRLTPFILTGELPTKETNNND